MPALVLSEQMAAISRLLADATYTVDGHQMAASNNSSGMLGNWSCKIQKLHSNCIYSVPMF